jgi:hypothetical protein
VNRSSFATVRNLSLSERNDAIYGGMIRFRFLPGGCPGPSGRIDPAHDVLDGLDEVGDVGHEAGGKNARRRRDEDLEERKTWKTGEDCGRVGDLGEREMGKTRDAGRRRGVLRPEYF